MLANVYLRNNFFNEKKILLKNYDKDYKAQIDC